MYLKATFLVFLLSLLSLSACVSKNKYLELEQDLDDSQNRLAQKEDMLHRHQSELQQLEERHDACRNNLENLQTQFDALKKTNLELSYRVKDLEMDLEKRKTTIHYQKKVISRLDDTKRKIERSMTKELEAKTIKLEEMEDKLKVTFVDKILFDKGSAVVNEKGKELLLQISTSLKGSEENDIMVEGHTDNIPIRGGLKSRFPTNWELSTSRATAVVRLLQDEAGISPERLSACGFSFYRPVASNDTEEGRSQNRRIEIILVPTR
jgi:chemotaxis protein MotB